MVQELISTLFFRIGICITLIFAALIIFGLITGIATIETTTPSFTGVAFGLMMSIIFRPEMKKK